MELQLFRGYTECRPTSVTIEEVVDLIRNDESLTNLTLRHRLQLQRHGTPHASTADKRSSPCIAAAVRFSGGKRREHIVAWTGLSLVDIDQVEAGKMPSLLDLIRRDPHTLLAYTTISGQGVRILYRWQLEQGEAMDTGNPPAPENLRLYHRAFQAGNSHYAGLLGMETDGQCKNATRLCGLAHDAGAYYNPDALPFGLTAERKLKKGRNGRSHALQQVLPVVTGELAKAGIVYEAGHRNEYISRMGYLMNLYGVSIEELTEWAVGEFADYRDDVAAVLRSCYTHTDEHGTRRLPRKQAETPEDERPLYPTVEDIARRLTGRGDYRYNVITGKCEHRPHTGREAEDGTVPAEEAAWTPIDNRFVHSVWRDLANSFKVVRTQDIHQMLMSEFVPPFNPFEQYFAGLPAWDGQTDYIAQVASTVRTRPNEDEEDDVTFEWAFRKWIVALVAGLFDRDKVNEEILVLVGRQGIYKTTWLNHLLPPALRGYFHTKTDSGRFDKDDKLALAEFALICLEEIEAMRPSELNQLKSLVTDKLINERPAYAHYKEERTHIASFCGTSNNQQFLNDESGERRWLAFNVENICSPHDHPLPYEGLYAQAYHLWREGFNYWFEGEEIERLNRHAQAFQVPDLISDLIHTHYRVPVPGEKSLFVTTADIVARISYAFKAAPAAHHIRPIMLEAGFKMVRRANRRGYLAVVLNNDQIEASRRLLATV